MEKEKYYDLKTLTYLVDQDPNSYFPLGVYESFSEEQKAIARDFMTAVTFLSLNKACSSREAIKIFSKMPLEDKNTDKVKMIF